MVITITLARDDGSVVLEYKVPAFTSFNWKSDSLLSDVINEDKRALAAIQVMSYTREEVDSHPHVVPICWCGEDHTHTGG